MLIPLVGKPSESLAGEGTTELFCIVTAPETNSPFSPFRPPTAWEMALMSFPHSPYRPEHWNKLCRSAPKSIYEASALSH